MRVVLTPDAARPAVGLVRHLYEVTNTLVSDWRAAADRYTRIFGLDPSWFSPIASERFGYVGTLHVKPKDCLDQRDLAGDQRPRRALGFGAALARHGASSRRCPPIGERPRFAGRFTTRRNRDRAPRVSVHRPRSAAFSRRLRTTVG
jgi:hypothetical protein